MAATVIDSLVVEVGLDPSNLIKGSKEAEDALKKARESSVKDGKEIETQSNKTSESIGGIRTQALGLAAVFGGVSAAAVLTYARSAISGGAAVGRLSRNLGVNATEISKWQGVATIFGSTAEGMASSFTSVSDAFAGWKVGIDNPLISEFRNINTAAAGLDARNAKIIDGNKGVTQSFLDLADNLKIIHDSNPALAGLLGRRAGLDPGLYDAAIQGSAKLATNLQNVASWTQKDADAAGELDRKFNSMVVSAERFGEKLVVGSYSLFEKIMNKMNYGDAAGDPKKIAAEEAEKQKAAKSGSAPGGGAFTSPAEKEAFIRSEAIRQGQNPDVWVKLAKSEGFYDYKGDPDAVGNPTSFGSMQLHYPGVGRNTADGLGTIFTKQTGLDARDPSTERRQIQFAMEWAKTHGLGDWHGWKGAQYANLQGVGNGGGGTKIDINGPITIQAGPNADGTKIANDFRAAILKRQADASNANGGQQ